MKNGCQFKATFLRPLNDQRDLLINLSHYLPPVVGLIIYTFCTFSIVVLASREIFTDFYQVNIILTFFYWTEADYVFLIIHRIALYILKLEI